AGFLKLPPLLFAAWVQAEFMHHAGEQSLQRLQIAEGRFGATVRFHNPFNSIHGSSWHLLWFSALRTELAGAGHGLAALHAKLFSPSHGRATTRGSASGRRSGRSRRLFASWALPHGAHHSLGHPHAHTQSGA